MAVLRSPVRGSASRFAFSFAAALVVGVPLAAQQWVPLDGPTQYGRMAAYDWARRRLVVVGGDGSTWEIDGGRMLQRDVGNSAPPPRRRAALAYDFAKGHVLMFGGVDGFGTMVQETWVFDGVRWRELLATPRPPVRVDAAMTYDVARQRIVMYGGQQLGIGQLDDTWEHDGTQWILRTPATVPGPNSPLMTYDFARGVTTMILHLGSFASPVATWEWDGVDWALRSTTGPQSRSNEGLTHDPFRGRTVLFGGVGNQGSVSEWDGTNWTSVPVPNAPSRIDPIVAYDVFAQRALVFGGTDFTTNAFGSVIQGAVRTDLWSWDGTSLVRVHDDLRPPSRFGTQAAAHPVTGEIVMFGGMVAQSPDASTWLWNGSRWHSPTLAVRPPARVYGAMCEDHGFARALLFGGAAGGIARNDLWGFDGAVWTLLDAGTGPSPRYDVTIARNGRNGSILLFGGAGPLVNTAVPRYADTWEWNGIAWMQSFPANAPSPRSAPAIGYDSVRDRMVLFGGRIGFTEFDQLQDTWEWDGTNWTAVPTATSPPAMLEPAFVPDVATGGLLLYGSTRFAGLPTPQVWRYSGAVWTQVSTGGSASTHLPVVYSELRDRVLSVNGAQLREITPTPAATTEIGSGCGLVVPRLSVRTRPRLGDPEFGLETYDRPDQPIVFVLGTAPASQPIGGGCVVFVGGTLEGWFAAPDLFGFSDVRLPLPATLAWRGLQLRAQAAVLDPNAPLGLRLTQGLTLTLGD